MTDYIYPYLTHVDQKLKRKWPQTVCFPIYTSDIEWRQFLVLLIGLGLVFFLLLSWMFEHGFFYCIVGCLSMIVWTPCFGCLICMSFIFLYFEGSRPEYHVWDTPFWSGNLKFCTCPTQLSMFHMERRSRNTIIIIITMSSHPNITNCKTERCLSSNHVWKKSVSKCPNRSQHSRPSYKITWVEVCPLVINLTKQDDEYQLHWSNKV